MYWSHGPGPDANTHSQVCIQPALGLITIHLCVQPSHLHHGVEAS